MNHKRILIRSAVTAMVAATLHAGCTSRSDPIQHATSEEKPIIEKFYFCVQQNNDPLVQMTEDELRVLVLFQNRMAKEGKPLLSSPIPLTSDLDRTLTEEGVLPPVEEEKQQGEPAL